MQLSILRWVFVFTGVMLSALAIRTFWTISIYENSSTKKYLALMQLIIGLVMAFYGYTKFVKAETKTDS